MAKASPAEMYKTLLIFVSKIVRLTFKIVDVVSQLSILTWYISKETRIRYNMARMVSTPSHCRNKSQKKPVRRN